jgi:signal transduction histidine kinase
MLVHPVGDGFASFLFILLCAQAGARYRTRDSLPVLVAALVVLLVHDLSNGSPNLANTAIGACFAWSVAAAFRSRQHVLDELQTAQRKLLERAAVDERQRIARDVHDLLAHTLSVTMLHLTGARLALQDGQSTEALQALEQAESGGRDVMREVRRTVGLLSDARQPDKALPGAPDISKLVHEYQLAGMRLTFDREGDLDRVPGDTGLAVYRIAQESLANAAKHSPGSPVCVRVSVHTAAVHIAVTNQRSGRSLVPAGGRGIPGMSERAALVGGTVTAGAIGSEWEVQAVLPTLDK